MYDMLSIGFGIDRNVPEVSSYLDYDIKNIKDLEIPKDPVIAYLSLNKFITGEKRSKKVTDTFIYMVGYEADVSDILNNKDNYDIANFEEFIKKCNQEDGKMAVFETADERKRVAVKTPFIKTFPNSDELIQAVVDFTTNFLEQKDLSYQAETPKTYCKM